MTELLASLAAFDTPTVCNAIERLAPERTGHGFTTQPLVCIRPDLAPIVGYARTGAIRAAHPSGRNDGDERAARVAYYESIAEGPHPSITVIEDLDPHPGVGAWWGEVQSNLHRGLGSLGVITNGSVRDLADFADGFQALAGSIGPSHAFVHPVSWGEPVTVHGMRVRPGDLIHADRHGAVVVPIDIADQIPAMARTIAAAEAVLIEASRLDGFGIDTLRGLIGGRHDH